MSQGGLKLARLLHSLLTSFLKYSWDARSTTSFDCWFSPIEIMFGQSGAFMSFPHFWGECNQLSSKLS